MAGRDGNARERRYFLYRKSPPGPVSSFGSEHIVITTTTVAICIALGPLLGSFLGHLARVTVPVLGYLVLSAYIVRRTEAEPAIPEIGRQVAAIVSAGRPRNRRRRRE